MLFSILYRVYGRRADPALDAERTVRELWMVCHGNGGEGCCVPLTHPFVKVTKHERLRVIL